MQLINGTFSSDTEMFRDIYNSLLTKEHAEERPYFILGDFRPMQMHRSVLRKHTKMRNAGQEGTPEYSMQR